MPRDIATRGAIMTLQGSDSPETPSPLYLYLKVIRDRWLVVLSVLIVTVISAVVFTSRQTPVYQATATVLIEPEAPKVVNIQEVNRETGGTQEYYATQYKVLQSRPVVEAVIQRLNLKQRMPHVGAAQDPYLAMIGDLTIDAIKNTRLVLVKFDDRDPKLATEIANAVADQFVKYGLEVKQAEAQTATVWLNEQIESLRAKAQQSSNALQAYQAKADLLGLKDQRDITQAKIIDFNRAYLEAQGQRMTAESRMRELSRIAKDPTVSETLLSLASDPLIQKLKTAASDLQIERSRLAQISREKHPDLIQLDAQIREVNQRLQAEIQKTIRAVETEYKVAKAREETLLANVNELRREARALNEREARALSLQREKDSVEDIQATVLKRLKETGLESALTASNIRVTEPAMPPMLPIRPRTRLIWSLASVFGLALGVGVAFVAESLDRRVRSPEDIEQVLGVPVLGVVPIFRSKRHV
jgi:polysaccharide biosynthesis transport protein